MRQVNRRPRRHSNAIIELQIAGYIVGKKNNLQFSASRQRAFYSTEARDSMRSIREQLDEQWRETVVTDSGPVDTPRPPLAHPAIAFVFYVSQRGSRSDRDNKLTTVLDELVAVGVLRDDSITSWNGPCLLASAVTTDGWAGARIFIEQRGNMGRLWRYVQGVPDLTTCRLQKPVARGFRFAKVTR